MRRTGSVTVKNEHTGCCIQCGKTVDGKKIVCSSRCATRMSRGIVEKSLRNCLECGVEISRNKRSDSKFCSQACVSKYKYDKERSLTYSANRRARLRGAEGRFTSAEWHAMIDYYGGVCVACDEVKPLTRDHVLPLFMGGSNWISNIQPLCLGCNLKKHVKHIDYRPDNGLDFLERLKARADKARRL